MVKLSSIKLEPDVNKNVPIMVVDPEFEDVTLAEFEIITTLGIGGFGRVELVRTCLHYSHEKCSILYK